VAILPQTWHVVRRGIVHRIEGFYNTDNNLFIEHESAECAFCQITKTYQPIDMIPTPTPAEHYAAILAKLTPEELADWGNITRRVEENDNDGADVYEAEELYKTFEEKYMIPTPTGNTGSSNDHARLAPSDAKRWTRCTAAIDATKGFKDEGSVYADEGTTAHEHAEAVLAGRVKIEDVPADFRPHIKTYVDHCLSLVPGGVTPFIEAKVPLFYDLNSYGTCDFAVVTSDRVWVRDYKHGAGVLVDVDSNPQLAIYALSFVNDQNDLYDFDPATIVDIGIVQPRHHQGDEIRTWELTLADLRVFCQDIQNAADKIKAGVDLEYSPDPETCRWCPKAWKVKCPARIASLVDVFDTPHGLNGIDFLSALEDLDKADSKRPAEDRVYIAYEKATGTSPLDDATLLRFWQGSKGIRAFLDDIDEVIQDRALKGDTFDGEVKLVLGRQGNRDWVDIEAADAWVKRRLKMEERYKMVLKSPTQIALALKDELASKPQTAKNFEALIGRSAAKSVAVPISDKREAVQCNAGFDNEEDVVYSSDSDDI
jgi:Protein of unknown function (DUF2800)